MNDIYASSPEGSLEFSPEFFEQCMCAGLRDLSLKVTAVRFVRAVGATATARLMYGSGRDKLLGLYHYEVDFTRSGRPESVEILVKSKIHEADFVSRLTGELKKAGVTVPEVSGMLARTELCGTHLKELRIVDLQQKIAAFTQVLPVTYGTYADDGTRHYVVLEEYLTGARVMKDCGDTAFWSPSRIEMAVRDFSRMHAAFYGKYEDLVAQGWLGKTINAGTMQELTPLWRANAGKLQHLTGSLFDKAYFEAHTRWIETLPNWWSKIDALKKTLIYNDARIRNVAIRNPETHPQLVLFGWDYACIQLPQRDLVEFLSHAISERTSDAELTGFLEAARAQLAADAETGVEWREWLVGCRYSIWDLHVNRLAFQLALHVTLERPEIERVFRASLRILRCIEKELAGLQ